MKRLLCLIIILSSVLVSHAQKYTYCTLHAYAVNLLSDKKGVYIYVDDGKSSKTLTDPLTNKKKPYLSIIEAINEFSLDGWEFVQTYVIVEEHRSTSRWIMRKKLSSTEEKDKTCPESQS